MRHHSGRTLSIVIVASLTILGMSSGISLGAGEGGASVAPAKVEKIPGSDLSKVVLTPKAAIKMGVVTEQPIRRWLLVAGEVEASATALEAGTATAAGTASNPPLAAPLRVRVPLVEDPNHATEQGVLVQSLQADDDDVDDAAKETTAVIISSDGEGMTPLQAKLVEAGPTEAKMQYYEVINGGDHTLRPGQHVQVRIPHPDNGKPQKVIPYSAVIYSPNGKAWTYTSTELFAFVRHPIEIDYIDGDRVILKEGPATGSPVVTVGTAELWGVEIKNGK
jgi:hypothetical protein